MDSPALTTSIIHIRDMTLEILSRLPKKLQQRLRLYNKLILPMLQFHHQSQPPKNLRHKLMYVANACELHSLSYNEDNHPVMVLYPNHPKHKATDLKIWGSSCNGVLCIGITWDYYPFCFTELYLWNPSTNISMEISCFKGIEPRFPIYPPKYSLGYNPYINDYEVVRVIHISSSLSCYAKVDVYSLRKDVVRAVPDIFYEAFSDSGVLVDGSMHWTAKRTNESRSLLMKVVVMFKIGSDSFEDVMLPYDDDNCHSWLAKWKGKLGLFRNHSKLGALELWVMHKGYSWEKLYDISRPGSESFSTCCRFFWREEFPVCISEDGFLVMKMRYGNKLIFYDPENRTQFLVELQTAAPLDACPYLEY